MSTEVMRYESGIGADDRKPVPQSAAELTIDQLVAQAEKIHAAMEKVMTDGEHYGVIPGTKKPTLYQPGAQKLLLLFRLDPQYISVPIAPDLGGGGHLAVKSVCTLWHIPSGQRLGSGEGICSTREVKYAYREARRKCPECGREAIIRGKEEYGGGWLCFKKREGCGAKFKDGDAAIEAQPLGRVANEDLADCYNTVLKMANKRALVAATLNVTAASDLFTQDLEEDQEAPAEVAPPRSGPKAASTSGGPHEVSGGERAQGDVPGSRAPSGVDVAPPAPSDVAAERDILNGRVLALCSRLGLKSGARAAIWTKHCGHASPDNVDVSALAGLVEDLRQQVTAAGLDPSA